MVGGASRVAMFPVALNALTPTSPPGKPPAMPPEILGEIHLGGALAAAVHALPLLGRRGGILAQTVLAVLPEALLAAREAAHEVGVATRLGHEALLVVRDVLALADVQLVSARGLVLGGGAGVTRALRQVGHALRQVHVGQVDLGNLGKVHLALELVDFIIDGRVADDERARGLSDAGAGAAAESRDAHRPRGGEGRDDGRHRREFSRLHVRTRATGVRSRRTTNDVQLAQPSAGQPVIDRGSRDLRVARIGSSFSRRDRLIFLSPRGRDIESAPKSATTTRSPAGISPERRARGRSRVGAGSAWPRADARRHGGPGPVPRARAGARARIIGGCHQEGVPQKGAGAAPRQARRERTREGAARVRPAPEGVRHLARPRGARGAGEPRQGARGEPREAEQQDAKRRKLREDLEAREARGGTRQERGRGGQERLRGELARLRRDFATRKRAYDRETAATTTPEEPAREAHSPADASRAVPEHLYRTIKVAWRRDASNYPAKRLRDVYAQFGTVEDVVIREERRKKKRAGGIRGSRDGGASRLGAGGRRRESAARRSSRRPAAGMDHAGARRRGRRS